MGIWSRRIFLLITMLCLSVSTWALDPAVEMDLKTKRLMSLLESRRFDEAIVLFEELEALTDKLPESFHYRFLHALSNANLGLTSFEHEKNPKAREIKERNEKRILQRAENYFARYGNRGKHYDAVLDLTNRSREKLKELAKTAEEYKEKRNKDQVAMAKYNDAMEKYRRESDRRDKECERRRERCAPRLDDCLAEVNRKWAYYQEREAFGRTCREKNAACIRGAELCERLAPSQPDLPYLYFEQSAKDFAAGAQPVSASPANPASPTLPIPSGGTTIQAAPATQAVPAPTRKTLEEQVQALVGIWAPDDANCLNSPTIKKIRREGNKLIDEVVERKDGSVVVVRTLESFSQSNIHTNSGDGLSYRWAGRNYKLNRDMEGVETISIANGSVIQPWSQVLGSDVIVRQGKRADGSPREDGNVAPPWSYPPRSPDRQRSPVRLARIHALRKRSRITLTTSPA